jgi:polysaccharide biosynthesis transport protein
VDSDAHLLDRLNAIYKYRYIVVTVFLLVMLGMVVKTYTTTPMYSATASLLIENERSASVAGFDAPTSTGWTDPEPYYQTQLRILTGREVATKVVNRLRLETVPEFSRQEPERRGLAAVLHTMKRQGRGVVRRLLRGAPPPESGAQGPPTLDELINRFLGAVSVDPVRGSRLYNVSVTSSSPTFAARAADTLVEEYVKQNFELRTQATAKSLQFLADEIVKQQAKVENSERAMAQYRETHNALSLAESQNTVVLSLNQANERFTQARTERIQKEANYNQVKSLPSAALAESIPAVTQNAAVQNLRQRLAELQRERVSLNERYGEKHPLVIQNANAIEDTTRQYQATLMSAVQSIRNDYEAAVSLQQRLAATLEEQKGAAMDLNRKSVSYTVLEREAQSTRQIYETLLKRQNELQIVSSSGANNVRLVDRAVAPSAPFQPDPQRDLMLGAIVGLVLAVGLVCGIDYLDDTIKVPEDIVRKLHLPFLGLVPVSKGSDARLLNAGASHEFGEAFRQLRTSLVFHMSGESTRVVLVTSAHALEGKTTTACNLAMALAMGGVRVLLVDADMRRPAVHQTLGLENARGLSDVLTGRTEMLATLQRLENPNLWVITAGGTPPNPSELLASPSMSDFMARAHDGPFDWVIIDTPPVLAVTDALILTSRVSGVAFVLGAGMTHRRLAERAIEMLATSNPPMVGAVLNRVDFARDRYYYSRYYGPKKYTANYAA